MCATKTTIEEVKSEWELSASYIERGEVDKFKGLNPGRSQAGVKKQRRTDKWRHAMFYSLKKGGFFGKEIFKSEWEVTVKD